MVIDWDSKISGIRVKFYRFNITHKLTEHFTYEEMLFGTNFKVLRDLPEDKVDTFIDLVYEVLENDKEFEIKKNLYGCACIAEVIKSGFDDKPTIITCGLRPKKWDISKGRSGKSQHTEGKAFDFYIVGVSLQVVFDLVNQIFCNGGRAINKAANFVHFDTLFTGRRTWTY